jgi:tetratricopeptide (TPR) repeat protein
MAVVFDLLSVRQALDAGDAVQALASAQQAVDAFPDNAAALLLQAEALLALGRWQEGLAIVDKALQLDPSSGWGYRLRCVALGSLGRNEEQIEAALHAVRLAPEEANAYFLLGKAFWQTSRDSQAREALSRAIALAPNVPLYRYSLAQLLFDSEPKQSQGLLRRIIADEPRNAAALNDLGVLLQREGRLKEASKLYRRAAQADPQLEAARNNAENVDWPVARWKLGAGLGLFILAGPTMGSALGSLWVWRAGHSLAATGLGVLSILAALIAVVAFGQALRAKGHSRPPQRS